MKFTKTLLLSTLLAAAAFNTQAISPQEQLKQGVVAYEQGNYQKAYELWLPLAEQGLVVAQYNLGVMYENGQGVKQDYQQAAKWYQKAAEQGIAEAQYNLGLMYYNGQGVKQDNVQAFNWWEKALANGDEGIKEKISENLSALQFAHWKACQQKRAMFAKPMLD